MLNIMNYENLYFHLIFTILLFCIGILGIFIIKQNIIIIFISIELLFLSINLNFLIFSFFLNDLIGQIFTLFVLTVLGSEAAVGLGILIIFYRTRGILTIDYLNSLKG